MELRGYGGWVRGLLDLFLQEVNKGGVHRKKALAQDRKALAELAREVLGTDTSDRRFTTALPLAASQVNEFLQSHTVLGQFLLADVSDSEEQARVAFVGV